MSFDLGALGNVSSAVAPSDYSLLYSSDGLNFSSVSTLSSAIINDNTVQFVLNASSVVNGFYTVGAATQSVLPLHLLSFDVQAIEGNAVLSWQTLDEINVNKFPAFGRSAYDVIMDSFCTPSERRVCGCEMGFRFTVPLMTNGNLGCLFV